MKTLVLLLTLLLLFGLFTSPWGIISLDYFMLISLAWMGAFIGLLLRECGPDKNNNSDDSDDFPLSSC